MEAAPFYRQEASFAGIGFDEVETPYVSGLPESAGCLKRLLPDSRPIYKQDKYVGYNEAGSSPGIRHEFHEWLVKRSANTVPGTSIGKAIAYTLGCWERLSLYLETPLLSPDKNRVENAIRPIVVGRKNWFFSESVLGAHTSATLYSVIETAKAYGHEP